MNKYEWVDRSFRAWSEMDCRDVEYHLPHVWESQYTMYGPYMCWGLPSWKDKMPTEEVLKELMRPKLTGVIKLRPYFPDASIPAEHIDALLKWLDS